MNRTVKFRYGWVILPIWTIGTVLAASVMNIEEFLGKPAYNQDFSFLIIMLAGLWLLSRIYIITIFIPSAFLFVKIKSFWLRFAFAFTVCAFLTRVMWFPISAVKGLVDIIALVVGFAILGLFSFLTARYIGLRGSIDER
ncbi:hypothetical protein [Litorimonas haliclonae]|uniref:hypothetical protein n=1 Tax=Litorimonas haliclonae TaxID=2081977 RepID=UPI0039EFE4CC